MLLLFFALSVAGGDLSRRPWADRWSSSLSAAADRLPPMWLDRGGRPCCTRGPGNAGEIWVFHDMAGWIMMPLALCLLGLS